MQSTGGVANRVAPLAARLEGRLPGGLPFAERFRDLRFGLGDKLASMLAAARAGALSLRRPAPPASEAHLGGRLHSLRRDREAVRHHYDVSNAFYRLVLGPSMVYFARGSFTA